MLRAAFQGNKQGIFNKMNAIMKNQDYIIILKISYLPSLEKIGCELGDTLFMQESDPKHKPKITLKWLHTKEITVMNWPTVPADKTDPLKICEIY